MTGRRDEPRTQRAGIQQPERSHRVTLTLMSPWGTGEIRVEISYTFAASYLLAWDSCPAAIKREFRSNPDTQVSVPDVIDGAMIALDTALLELIKARMP